MNIMGLSKEAEKVTQEMYDHVQKCGGISSSWYVGLTNDPQRRLFEEHGVRRNGDACIFRTFSSNAEARKVENMFITLGASGGSGGGDWRSTTVYTYRKTRHSSP